MSGWGTPLPQGTARAIALEERGAEDGHHATISAQVHTVSIRQARRSAVLYASMLRMTKGSAWSIR